MSETIESVRADYVRVTRDLEAAERRFDEAEQELAIVKGELKELTRKAQIQPKPFRPDLKRIDAGDWVRASQYCVCDVCGFQYWEHATVQGFEWIHRICDGRLVKL